MTEPAFHHRFAPWTGAARTAMPWEDAIRWSDEAHDGAVRVLLDADPFDPDLDEGARSHLLDLMARTPRINWLVTTESADLVEEMAPNWMHAWPANVWMGVRLVKSTDADRLIYGLLELPAPVRFALCDPLVAPMELQWVFDPRKYACCGRKTSCGEGACPVTTWPREEGGRLASLDWVIAGGELGETARPLHPEWARTLRDECAAAKVAFTFTGMGEWEVFHEVEKASGEIPACREGDSRLLSLAGFASAKGPKAVAVRRVGRLFAGMELDGRLHAEMPEARTRTAAVLHADTPERPRARA